MTNIIDRGENKKCTRKRFTPDASGEGAHTRRLRDGFREVTPQKKPRPKSEPS